MFTSAALVFAFTVLSGRTVAAGDAAQTIKDLQRVLACLEDASNPVERRRLVAELGTVDHVRAAERLRRIVRSDPDAGVRAEAAQALARSPVAAALDYLLDLALEGGPLPVRQAVGRAIAQRGGRDRLMARFEKETDDLGHGLLIAALADDPAPDAAAALERLASSSDAQVRCEALRGLARHAVGRQLLADALRAVLAKHRDIDTIVTALDVADALADDDVRALADLLGSFLEPEARNGIDALRARIAYLDALDAARLARRNTEYAPAGGTPLPEPPTPRPRIDIVYMFDASGSVSGYMDVIRERIRREAETLRRVGTDYRIGVVAYRDTALRRDMWATRVLPLTYDLARAEAFMGAVASKGTGSGSAVDEALEQSLDRMGWRRGALRQVGLICDSKTGDAEHARAIVRIHYQTDRTRLHVWYLYRTRTQIPAEVAELARTGGGVVESLE